MQRVQFVLLVLVAAMLGALISMVDSSLPTLAITLGHGYASLVALGFALMGAYAGALAGRRPKPGSQRHQVTNEIGKG